MTRARIAIALILTLLASSLAAQTPCQLTDTISACWDRAFGTVQAEQQTAQATATKTQLAKEPVGADTGGENLAATKKSLLPLMSLSGLLGDGLQQSGDGTYVLDLNPLLFPGQDKDFQLQTVFKTELDLAEPIAQALPEAMRDEQKKQLLASLGDLADYTITLTYNPTARRFGRGFEQYRPLFMALAESATNSEPPAALNQELLELLAPFDQVDPTATPFTDLTEKGQKVDQTRQRLVMAAVETDSRRLAQREVALSEKMKSAHLDTFHELVDNQRQLYFSAQRRLRDPLIGGNELSLKLTYEWSGINLNQAVDKACAAKLRSSTDDAAVTDCLKNYVQYMESNEAQIDGASRFSFSGEYLDIDAATADLSAVGLGPVTLDGAKKLVITAGWGRELLGPDGTPITLDLHISHEDVSEDPMRQDRTLVTLTLTRKIGQVDIPFGIVYANHGEYLTDVDEKLSAHIGLRFSAMAPKKDK